MAEEEPELTLEEQLEQAEELILQSPPGQAKFLADGGCPHAASHTMLSLSAPWAFQVVLHCPPAAVRRQCSCVEAVGSVVSLLLLLLGAGW